MMTRNKLFALRNIGIAAHIDAGKTTLTERILYFTGKSHRLGETHTGNSQMDTMKQEIEKGITISSAATHTEWQYQNQQYKLNIIDTPGHIDFMIEVERALRVLDGMVALFDAVAGVESQTETIWRQAQRYQIPIIAMVNKMDRAGAKFLDVVQQINNQLGANAVAIQIPIGMEKDFQGLVDLIELKAIYWNEKGEMDYKDIPSSLMETVNQYRTELIETLALFDEALLAQYLEDVNAITPKQLKDSLRNAVLNKQVVPVLLGAAYKNKGVHTLLDAICNYLPSPQDRATIEGSHPSTDEKIIRHTNTNEAFSALVFKIALDDQNRQLSFFRVYSGILKVGDTLLNPRTGKKEKISRLYQMHSNKRQEIQYAMAGDIAATTNLKQVQTGDTLCSINEAIVLESLIIPSPVISMAIEAKSSDQLNKLGSALSKLQLEDPSFKVKTDQATGQTIILGMGELHLEIIIDKLKEDFNIEMNTGSPKVNYNEAFTKTVRQKYRLKKQRGGTGMYAEIEVLVGPVDNDFLESDAYLNEGKRLQFVNKIVGGSIPKEFIPSIVNGFNKELENGPLAGYPIQNLKVELLDGDTHSNDSNAMAFETCARETFRSIALMMNPQLLEPIVEVDITTPNEYLGNILSGLNRRRGMIQSQEVLSQQIQLNAEVPLMEMFGYINHLRTVSSGRANYSMKFKHYAPLPTQLADAMIANEN